MSYCFEKAIPHSEFLKWEPEDRAKTLAYALEQSTRCSSCGTAPWEWEDNKFAYTAVDELCQGCYQKTMYSEGQSRSLPGTSVKLVPNTPLLRAQMTVNAKKRAIRDREAKDKE